MSLAHPAQVQHELSISRLIDAPPAKVFRAWHWNAADCRAHEEMGFHQGWGESLDRLVEVVTQRMPD